MEQQMGLSNAMLGNSPNPPGAERDVMGPSPRPPAAQAFPTHPLLDAARYSLGRTGTDSGSPALHQAGRGSGMDPALHRHQGYLLSLPPHPTGALYTHGQHHPQDAGNTGQPRCTLINSGVPEPAMGRAGASQGSAPDSAWGTRSPTHSGASTCGAMQSPKQVTETGLRGGVTCPCSGAGLSEQGAALEGAHPARVAPPPQPSPAFLPVTGASAGDGHRTSLVSTPRGLSTTQVKLVCRCRVSKELKCRSRCRATPEPCGSSLWTQRGPISAHSRLADPPPAGAAPLSLPLRTPVPTLTALSPHAQPRPGAGSPRRSRSPASRAASAPAAHSTPRTTRSRSRLKPEGA